MTKIGPGSTVRYISPGGRRYTVQVLATRKDDLGRGIVTVKGWMDGREETMEVWVQDVRAIGKTQN